MPQNSTLVQRRKISTSQQQLAETLEHWIERLPYIEKILTPGAIQFPINGSLVEPAAAALRQEFASLRNEMTRLVLYLPWSLTRLRTVRLPSLLCCLAIALTRMSFNQAFNSPSRDDSAFSAYILRQRDYVSNGSRARTGEKVCNFFSI